MARVKGSKASKERKAKKTKQIMRRLVAIHNIDRMRTKGYKLIESDTDKLLDKHERLLGIKVHAKDLVLMEKES